MNIRSDQLDRLRVAAPCPVSWNQMSGDERTRFCEQCHLHVYNIAEMTRTEVASLIESTEGRICGRIYRRADGTVITKDCPVGLRAIRRRVAKTAAAVFATVASLSAVVMGQKPAAKEKQACQPQVTLNKQSRDALVKGRTIAGTVLDPNRGVIPGAKVKIIDLQTQRVFETQSNDEGWFVVTNLEPGVYEVAISATGFKNFRMLDVRLTPQAVVDFDVILELAGGYVTVGIIAETLLIDPTHPDLTIFSGDQIRRLPH